MIDTKLPPKPPLYPGIRLQISAKAFLQAAHFRAEDDIRYYLNGVNIVPRDAGGVYVIGCDGHVMGVVAVADAVAENLPAGGVILRASPKLLLACRGPNPMRRGADMFLCIEEDRVSVATELGMAGTDFETFTQPGKPWIEGKFPDWRRVLPDFTTLKRTVEDDFNGKLLAKFTQIKSPTSERWGAAIRLWQPGKDRSIVVQRVDIPEFVGILMPMRGADEFGNAKDIERLAKEWPKPAAPVEGGAA